MQIKTKSGRISKKSESTTKASHIEGFLNSSIEAITVFEGEFKELDIGKECLQLSKAELVALLEKSVSVIFSLQALFYKEIRQQINDAKSYTKNLEDSHVAHIETMEWAKTLPSKTRSASASVAANKRHEPARARREEIQAIWATGKYISRDICAEEEYSAIGFLSYKAARNALTNTPAPSPWPVKESAKKQKNNNR